MIVAFSRNFCCLLSCGRFKMKVNDRHNLHNTRKRCFWNRNFAGFCSCEKVRKEKHHSNRSWASFESFSLKWYATLKSSIIFFRQQEVSTISVTNSRCHTIKEKTLTDRYRGDSIMKFNVMIVIDCILMILLVSCWGWVDRKQQNRCHVFMNK